MMTTATKRLFYGLVIAFLLPWLSGSALAQDSTLVRTTRTADVPIELAEDDKSLLWIITGEELEAPSFLYGTIHIQDERVFNYAPVVQQAFDAADAFAMELLLDEVNMVAAMSLMVMPGDTTLTMLLSEEDYALVKDEVFEKTGQSMFMFERMRPLFLSSQLQISEGGSEMALPLDMHLDAMAKEQEKRRLGIEKFEHQAAAVKAIPLSKQAELLITSIEDTSSGYSQFEEIITLYLSGDVEEMVEMSSDDELMPDNFAEEFLVKRNKVMAENIAKFSGEQTTFSAVGAAHLGGPDGVIALLRKAGYEVRPVKAPFPASE